MVKVPFTSQHIPCLKFSEFDQVTKNYFQLCIELENETCIFIFSSNFCLRGWGGGKGGRRGSCECSSPSCIPPRR